MNIVWAYCPYCEKRLLAKEEGAWVQMQCPRCRVVVLPRESAKMTANTR